MLPAEPPFPLSTGGASFSLCARALWLPLGTRPPPLQARLPSMRIPSWSSKWAFASFAKLRALALLQFERVILLDTECAAEIAQRLRRDRAETCPRRRRGRTEM